MQKSVIIIKRINDLEDIEVWSSLTRICEGHMDFSYHYLKRFDFPFEYKGWHFSREKLNPRMIRTKFPNKDIS